MRIGIGRVGRWLNAGGPLLWPAPTRFGVAILLTVLALGLRFLIAPQEVGIPFVTFFPAATLAALIGGLWPGLFATLLGAMAALFFFVPPFNAFKVETGGLLSSLVFCLDQVVVCSAIEALRRYHRASLETSAALRAAHAGEARARRQAERANDAKSRFLAAASHDLRQPYQALRLYHAAMEGKIADPAALAELLRGMDRALAAGEGLLQSLLDLSTLEAGIVVSRPIEVDAADLVEAIGLRHQPVAEAKGLVFRLDADHATLMIDPVLLGRLLDNLIVNAIRYTERGHIRIGFRCRGGRAWFLVADTGIGIAAEHSDAVFEEFFQIGNPARDATKGVGLGLAVVSKMAELMGIRVRLRSLLGKGTVFKVELPAKAVADGEVGGC